MSESQPCPQETPEQTGTFRSVKTLIKRLSMNWKLFISELVCVDAEASTPPPKGLVEVRTNTPHQLVAEMHQFVASQPPIKPTKKKRRKVFFTNHQ